MKFRKSFIVELILAVSVAAAALFGAPVQLARLAESITDTERNDAVVDTTADQAVVAPLATTYSDAFHFLEPLAPRSGDPSKFDSSLLNYLKVEICNVAAECTVVKTLTSQSASAERIRIEKGGGWTYYIANWDTQRVNLGNKTYRVRVFAASVLLGEIDLTPDVYNTFGRTWPIKFMIETDAELRTRIFGSAGMSIWEVADDLRTELGICGEELRQILLANYPNATAAQVAEVVNGVCQEVELLPTTKIADRPTRDALALYDMATGRMIFAGDTTLLKNLRVNDVIVSRPGPAAPYGYLRKVLSIRKERGMYALATIQAKFTEAIGKGTLQVSGPLVPSSSASTLRQNSLVEPKTRSLGASFDEGDQLIFTKHIEETINLEGGDDEVGGTGTIKVIGDIYINAGYNIGAGIEWCGIVPCADRLEAWMGFEHKSDLRVIGDFDGHVRKQIEYPIPMQPIFFMIGLLPVVLVPEVNVIVGVDGNAHIDFEFKAGSDVKMKPYIKWTDDNGGTWQDLTQIDDPLEKTYSDVDISGSIEVEVYAKLDASLLLYDAIGPSMDGSLGIGSTTQFGNSALWTIFGHANVGIGLKSNFTDLFDIDDPRAALLDERFEIAHSANQPPEFSNVRDGAIQARVNQPVFIGPDNGLAGKNYDVTDPEGDIPSLSYSVSPDGVVSGQFATFSTPGLKTVKVTARDSANLTTDLYLGVDVRNSPPQVTIGPASGEVPAQTQYWLTASAYDPDEGTLRCSRLTWDATGPGTFTKTVSSSTRSCTTVFKFNTPGSYTVTVSATDSLGVTRSANHNVLVDDPPPIPYPEIAPDSFSVTALSRIRRLGDDPFDLGCLPGQICEVENGDLIYNGYGGDFIPPLILRVTATDPSGAPLIIDWRCQTGENFAPITANADGSHSCTPIYSPFDPIKVYAFIYTPPPAGGEGFGPATLTEVRTYLMLQAPN